MDVCIRLPRALREVAGGSSTVTISIDAADDAVTVEAILDELALTHPALERRVRDEEGRPRVHVNVFVGDDNVRDLDGLVTCVTAGQDLSILPAISGG